MTCDECFHYVNCAIHGRRHREPPWWILLLGTALLALILSPLLAFARADESTTTYATAQTTTFGTQTAGTFPECGQQDDGTVCTYQESDAGDGETHDAMLLPNLDTGTTGWTASGCAEATEYQCVDEGGSHDSDTTYVMDNAIAGTNSQYEVQNCPASMCISGTTYLSTSMWAVGKYVDGADPDVPGFLFGSETSGGTPCTVRTTTVTTSYVNYSTLDFSDCSGTSLSASLIDGIVAKIAISSIEPTTDDLRVTALGVTINLRHPNWRDDVIWDFTGLQYGRISTLFLRASVSTETASVQLYDYSSAAWNTRFSITGGTLAQYEYSMQGSEIDTSGTARVRFLDTTQSIDETQDTLSVDSAWITQIQLEGGGGSGNPLRASCAYDFLFQNLRCTDTTPWHPSAQVYQVCWLIDGRALGCSGRGGTVSGPAGNGFFSLGEHQHHIVQIAQFSGQGNVLSKDYVMRTDDFPRFLLWAGLVLLILGGLALYRRAKRPRFISAQRGYG